MSEPLRFQFPMPENLANGRHHWRALHRKQKAYFAALDALQLTNKIPAPPSQPFERVVVSATLHLGAAMDEENAMVRASKWPMDWLKTRGYVTNDARKNLSWTGFPRQIVRRLADKNYHVDITLTPLLP